MAGMHVLMAQRLEDLACEYFAIAAASLPKRNIHKLMSMQARAASSRP